MALRLDIPLMLGISLLFTRGLRPGNQPIRGHRWPRSDGPSSATSLRPRASEEDRRDGDVQEAGQWTERSPLLLVGALLMGTGGLYFGSEAFVDGARRIALDFGVSDRVVGLTVVAFGTSVPELVASGIAALRGQADLAIGNVVGSNLFNLLPCSAVPPPHPAPGRQRARMGLDVGHRHGCRPHSTGPSWRTADARLGAGRDCFCWLPRLHRRHVDGVTLLQQPSPLVAIGRRQCLAR